MSDESELERSFFAHVSTSFRYPAGVRPRRLVNARAELLHDAAPEDRAELDRFLELPPAERWTKRAEELEAIALAADRGDAPPSSTASPAIVAAVARHEAARARLLADLQRALPSGDGNNAIELELDVDGHQPITLDVTEHIVRYDRAIRGLEPLQLFRDGFGSAIDKLVVTAATLCSDVRAGRRSVLELEAALRIVVLRKVVDRDVVDRDVVERDVLERDVVEPDVVERAVGAGLVARLVVACTSGEIDAPSGEALTRADLPPEEAWERAVDNAFFAAPDWLRTSEGHALLSALPSREGLVLAVLDRARLTGERFLVQLGTAGFAVVEGAAVLERSEAAREILRSAPAVVRHKGAEVAGDDRCAPPTNRVLHAIVDGRIEPVRFRIDSTVRADAGSLAVDDVIDDFAGDLARCFPKPSLWSRARTLFTRPIATLRWTRAVRRAQWMATR